MPGIVAAIADYPVVALMKGLVSGYRYVLLAATILVALLALPRLGPAQRGIVIIGASYALTRTLALSFFHESRYMVEAVPGMEVAVEVALVALWRERRNAVASTNRL